jgi:NTP pyrophosphatase (non-canonical NTP hydrolase)
MDSANKPDTALRACAEAPAPTEGEVMDDDQSRSETPEISQPLQSSVATDGVITTPAPERLTFAQFSAVNRQRCESPDGFNHRLDSWSTSDWFLATLGELGEAANIAKKLNRYRDGIPGNKESEAALRDKLRKELGDVYVYLDLLAQSLGVEIGAAAVEVFNAKSEEIGCPIRIPPPLVSAPPAQAPTDDRDR